MLHEHDATLVQPRLVSSPGDTRHAHDVYCDLAEQLNSSTRSTSLPHRGSQLIRNRNDLTRNVTGSTGNSAAWRRATQKCMDKSLYFSIDCEIWLKCAGSRGLTTYNPNARCAPPGRGSTPVSRAAEELGSGSSVTGHMLDGPSLST